jgi:hypothetical protein
LWSISESSRSRSECSKIPPKIGELLGERIDLLLDFVSDHDGLLLAEYTATGDASPKAALKITREEPAVCPSRRLASRELQFPRGR